MLASLGIENELLKQQWKKILLVFYSCFFSNLFCFNVQQGSKKHDATWTQHCRGKSRLSLRKYTWFVCARPVLMTGQCFYSCIYLLESVPGPVQSEPSVKKRSPIVLHCHTESRIYLFSYLLRKLWRSILRECACRCGSAHPFLLEMDLVMVEDVPPASECKPIGSLLTWLSESLQTNFKNLQQCSSGWWRQNFILEPVDDCVFGPGLL